MSATVAAFAFKPGDLVLVKWNDSMVYFAKIKKIDQRRKKCVVVFDDKSQDDADFDQIHSVDETTTDIICIKCKRDDSDSPNEIVLCDRCGIGYHQKCHTPPIPASALELDTPWNCAYCLKGVKCPYLTESLDVLQNLLSDEESQSHDDIDSVTTMESDEGGEEFTSPAIQVHGKFLAPPRPQKKRGRKPKVKRGPKPKDPAKPHADAPQCTREGSDRHSGSFPANSETAPSPSTTKDESYPHLKRKRSQFSAMPVQKRLRKPSVQSQTLSVTRIPGPVHGENISPKFEDIEDNASHSPQKLTETTRNVFGFRSPSKSPPTKTKRSKTSESSLMEMSTQQPEDMPRSLRVSLSLPEETEPGSPLEKILRSQKILSPKFTITSLPLWEDHLKSDPSSSGENSSLKSPALGKQSRDLSRQQSPTESQSSTPKNEGPLTPFTASALPLQAGVKTSQDEHRKRKSGERDVVDASFPTKKTKLSTPDSPLDDVFSTSKKSVSGNTAMKSQMIAVSLESDPLTSAVKPQPLETGPGPAPPVKIVTDILVAPPVKIVRDILVETPTPPVGYGAEPLSKVGESLIQEAATIPERPSPVDKGKLGGIAFPTTKPVSSAPIVNHPRRVSATVPTAGGDMGGKQAVTSLPIKPSTTEQMAGTERGFQSPRVIKSPLEHSDATNGCSVGYSSSSVPTTPVISDKPTGTPSSTTAQSQSQSPTIVKSPAQIPAVSEVGSPSAATAVSVITVHSSATTPVSTSVGTSHTKLRHTSKTADNDIIITSVEVPSPSTTTVINKAPPSYTEAVHSKGASSVPTSKVAPSVVAAYTPTIKGRPQSLNGKQTVAGMKVSAKIAEIKPGPTPVTSSQVKQGVQQRCMPQKGVPLGETQSRQRASSVVKPAGSSVSVVPLVTTPTAYTQTLPHHDNTAYTIVPAEAVAQGRAIAIPPTGAVKPGTLPINDATTAVVVQQTPQTATQFQYILEPLVPTASTSVVYNQTAGIPATAVTPTRAIKGSSDVYAQVIGNKSLPVTTTKPYAIVPAQPTASIEIQGIAIDQRGTSVIGPQMGYSAVPGASYIQAVVTPTAGKPNTTDNWTHSIKSSKTSYQVSGHQRVPDEQAASQLDEIGKKISDAFANSSERLLISAFEDAWKKFQANGRRYQSTAGVRKMGQSETVVHTKPIAPPNAEVVSVPGTSSRLSLIRPTYSKSKISALQSSPDQVLCMADTQPSVQEPQQKQQQYQYVYYSDGPVVNAGTAVYAITPTDTQLTYDRMMKHAQPQGKPGHKTYQVQSSGVYVPARATDLGNGKHATVAVDNGSTKGVVKAPRNQQMTERAVSVVQQKQATEHAVQHLGVLRKSQPSVGNGEYALMKQKTLSTAGKTVHQCALCTKEATYLCSGCRRIWYCGKDCQLKAWDEHSETCKS